MYSNHKGYLATWQLNVHQTSTEAHSAVLSSDSECVYFGGFCEVGWPILEFLLCSKVGRFNKSTGEVLTELKSSRFATGVQSAQNSNTSPASRTPSERREGNNATGNVARTHTHTHSQPVCHSPGHTDKCV